MIETSKADLSPSDNDAERAVLGSVFIRGHVNDVLGLVQTDDFLAPAHREISESMFSLAADLEPIDPVTVSADLRARGMIGKLDGAESYLMGLSGAVPTAESGPHYARIVRDKARARKIIAACLEAIHAASKQSPEEVSADLRAALSVLSISDGGPIAMSEAIPPHLELLDARKGKPRGLAISTCIGSLDNVLGGGHRKGQAVVIAGRPSMGKSAHTWATLIRAAVESEVAGLFFSQEMQREELLDRALALITGIDGAKIQDGDLDYDGWKLIEAKAKIFRAAPLSIDDRKLTVDQVVAESTRWRSKNPGPALIAVDYLQLLRSAGKAENRQQEVAGMMRDLKIMAGDLGCVVLIVSQLNRESAKGDIPRRPVLSDLRESGGIEQDADVVIFTWRSGLEEELIVAKNRGRGIGIASVRWDGPRTAFFDNQGEAFAANAEPEGRYGT
jgi:replicative DNA helicase